MLRVFALTVVALSLATASPSTADTPQRGQPVAQPKRGQPPNPELMQTYYFVLLYRGEHAASLPQDSVNAIQAGHMANIQRLHDEKKMVLAGPFLDDTALRGIFILQASSMEEAQKLCDSDPAIQAGRLRAEIHPWYAARGIRTVFDDKYKLKPDASAK